jgi:hypothetical protein
LVISGIAALGLILLPIKSVVNTNVIKSKTEKIPPLFIVRSQRSLKKDNSKNIITNYLGKGEQLNLLLPKKQ